MSDQFDRASDLEMAMRADALQAHQRRVGAFGFNAGKTVADSAALCSVCEERIPIKRRRAVPGVQTCVSCQTDLEHALR